MFVEEFCFQYSTVEDFKVKVKLRGRHLSVRGILYVKLKWTYQIQIITKMRIVLRQNIIYIVEAVIKFREICLLAM